MAGVRTSIIGRPRPSPPHRRAANLDHAHQPATTPSAKPNNNSRLRAFRTTPSRYSGNPARLSVDGGDEETTFQ